MTRHSLWAGIVCAQLPLQAPLALVPAPPDRPCAVHAGVRGRATIIAADRSARTLGVYVGQALAEALAIAPGLLPLARNRAAERGLLEEIALVAYRYSHQVALTGDGVVLEIGSSRRLHGNPDTLLAALGEALAARRLSVRSGSAPVPAAACLLARYRGRADTPEALEAMLGRWPLQRLALDGSTLERLCRLGLRNLEQVLALPRFERERRLGQALNRYLDELRGRRHTPLVYWQPPERFRERLELPVPSARHEALLFAFNRMLARLEAWLRARDRALTGLRVLLHPEDRGRVIELRAGLGRAGFQRERILEILRLKLEPIRLHAAIETLGMHAESTLEHRPPQADLWTGTNVNDAWPALLDRLRARIGDDGLCGITPRPDHRPEKAWAWTDTGSSAAEGISRPRPNWLLPEPRPCRIDDLRLIDGPERIESGWWDGHDCRRDYWSAHDCHGNRLWVFREYKPRDGWFVHGLFG